MTDQGCCATPAVQRGASKRTLPVAGCVGPGLLLTLMPKCPACLAVYFAATTGVGLSMSTASYLRMVLILMSVAAVVYFAAKIVTRCELGHGH